jgi:hypothetical protein
MNWNAEASDLLAFVSIAFTLAFLYVILPALQ